MLSFRHFGRHFDYDTNSASTTEYSPIPKSIQEVKHKIERENSI